MGYPFTVSVYCGLSLTGRINWNCTGSWHTETLKDACTIAKTSVKKQRGLGVHRKAIVSRRKDNRLRAVYYQDAYLGYVVWESKRMETAGHLLPAEQFSHEYFDRLIDHYHRLFDIDMNVPMLIKRLVFTKPDPETLESIRTENGDRVADLYTATLQLDDLVLYDAGQAILDHLIHDHAN